MPYLDRIYRDELVTRKRSTRPNLSAFDFADRTDRTLTLGRNQDGTILHVYIKSNLLYAHKYLALENGEYSSVVCFVGRIDPTFMQPTDYAIPRATDSYFAETMMTESLHLNLVEWDSKENQIEDSDTGYFGQLAVI